MDREKIKELLQNVKAGKIEVAEALSILKSLPYEDLGFAKIDTHRDLCAPGVVVVNIDNGFGAGYFVSVINQMGEGK